MVTNTMFSRALRLCAVFLIIALLPCNAYAKPRIQVDIQPRVGAIDETFQFTIIVSDSQNADFPVLDESADFTVAGPEVQMLANFDQSSISVRKIYTFSLAPIHIGSLSTPSGKIEVDGETFKIDALRVRVTSASDKNPGNQDVLLKQYLDRKEVYVGEQVLNTIEIMSRIRLYDLEIETPNYEGFWTESLGTDQTGRRRVGSMNYDTYRINRAIYPLRSGLLVLPKRTISARVRERSNKPRGIFDPFGLDLFERGKLRKMELSSNILELTAKPLPKPPAGFQGWNTEGQPVVGATEIRLEYSPRSLKVGESKTLSFEVTSKGNINPLKEVPLPSLKTYRVYAEQPDTSQFDDGGQLVMKKRFNISLVPNKPGKIFIPAVRLGYFDPESGSYLETKTSPIEFTVEGPGDAQPEGAESAESAPAPEQSPASQERVDPLMRYEPAGLLESWSGRVSVSLALLLCLLVAALGGAGFFALRLYRAGAAQRNLEQRVLRAASAEELNHAFRDFLKLQLKIEEDELQGDQMKALLNRGVENEDLRFNIQLLIDEFDSRLYGGKSVYAPLEELKERVESVVRGW